MDLHFKILLYQIQYFFTQSRYTVLLLENILYEKKNPDKRYV